MFSNPFEEPVVGVDWSWRCNNRNRRTIPTRRRRHTAIPVFALGLLCSRFSRESPTTPCPRTQLQSKKKTCIASGCSGIRYARRHIAHTSPTPLYGGQKWEGRHPISTVVVLKDLQGANGNESAQLEILSKKNACIESTQHQFEVCGPNHS